MAEPVKPQDSRTRPPSPNGQKDAQGSAETEGRPPLRRLLTALLFLVPLAVGQGCATQDAATRAAEQAASENEDDATCSKKGAPKSAAYDACRKELAQSRAQAGGIQEQKRRDFDRVLGAGTEGQSNY
jgi:hypothetical protein